LTSSERAFKCASLPETGYGKAKGINTEGVKAWSQLECEANHWQQ